MSRRIPNAIFRRLQGYDTAIKSEGWQHRRLPAILVDWPGSAGRAAWRVYRIQSYSALLLVFLLL